ncbi:MAG: tetratricopeptide repeat protein [Verrucomicrobiota bacterium]
MNAIVVSLKDFPGLENIDPSKMSAAEVEAAVRRCFAFFPKSANIRVDGEIVTIELPEAAVADAEEAVRLCERAGKRAGEGNYRKAVDIYKRALELDPGLLRARRDLAMAYVELEEFDEAKNHLIEVLRLDPKDCWSWVVLANLYSKHDKDFATAEKFHLRALDAKPNDPWALNGLAAVKMEQGQPNEAIKCFDAAIAAHPKFANALYGKAIVLQRLGELLPADKVLKTLFQQGEFQDSRSAPVFNGARQLIVQVENELANKLESETFKTVENYRAEVETLSGFPVRVVEEEMPEGTTGVAQMAWKYGREYHVIKHTPSAPPPVAQHLIAHELTHIRLESLARRDSKNKLFATTAASRETAIRSIANDIRRLEKEGYPHDSITKVSLQLVEGTCRFLFNCPLDLIIEYYLQERFPDLQYAQFVSLGKMAVDAKNSTMNQEVRKLTPRKILQATTALNGAYAILLDELNASATNFAAVYQKHDTFALSKKLAGHWRTRHHQLGPGDEYILVDEFSDMLGLRDWYEWRPDTGRQQATQSEKPVGTTNPELLKQNHPAAVFFLLDALERYEQLPIKKIKEITLEIALIGRNGLDYADSTKKYRPQTLAGESFSGLHLMCLMFAGFKRFAPEHDVSMDLEKPFLTALEIYNAKKGKA